MSTLTNWRVVALLALAVGVGLFVLTARPTAADHRGTFDATCRSDMIDVAPPSNLRPYIEKACFDKSAGIGEGVWLYLTDSGYSTVRYLDGTGLERDIADWIVRHPIWTGKGDRSSQSVSREIEWHAFRGRQYTHPTHIEYDCIALGWSILIYGC